MSEHIRIATQDDAKEILYIYSYYIEATAITFEYELPSLDEFKKRIEKISSQYPWLVYEVDHKIVGYAYASMHKERAAYQWNVELSVYISHHHQGYGIGKKLYRALISIVTYQGYYNAYGCIALPNEKSIALHKYFGFHEIGIFPKSGNKFNTWYDIIWFGKRLKDEDDMLKPLVLITNIKKSIVEKLIHNR